MGKQKNTTPLTEEEKEQYRERTNRAISRFCNYAALLIILIALASFIIQNADGFFVQLGIMVSIALLAIAAINDPTHK